MSKDSLIILLLFFLTGLDVQAQRKVKSAAYNTMLSTFLSHTVEEISVDSLEDWIGTVTLLDAREGNEYEVSHIEGAIHVGYDDFDTSAVSSLNRKKEIIVYCSIGYRSEKIAERLIDMGFVDVKNLYGGIFEWVNQNNPVVNKEGSTEQIHGYSRTWGIWLKEGEKVFD